MGLQDDSGRDEIRRRIESMKWHQFSRLLEKCRMSQVRNAFNESEKPADWAETFLTQMILVGVNAVDVFA